MYRNIKIQLAVVLCTALLAISCLEDEGNYDYIKINEVAIAGIAKEYSVPRFDSFNIVPELSFTQDNDTEERYSYKWLAYKQAGLPIDPDKLTDLSNERDLTIDATLHPGMYTIYYTVTDTETEVEWQYNFEVEIVNSIYEGWLLLNNIESESRLDMISLLNEEYLTKHDILGLAGSELVLSGKPGFVTVNRLEPNFYGIYVSTSGNGTTKIEPNTFSWNKAFDLSKEFGTSQPDGLEAQSIHEKSSGTSFCTVDGNIYYYYFSWRYKYSTPINVIDGIPFEASPMIGVGNTRGSSIFYDNTNLRFTYFNGRGCYEMPPAASTLFNYNTGKDLVYLISNSYNGDGGKQTFAVLKDPIDGKQYMARFNASTFVQYYYDEITATDFDQATNITINPEFGYLFYAVGSKVYEYDLYTKETIEMLNKGSEEITLLKFHNFASSKYSEKFGNKLIVCSNNASKPQGTGGTFELYTVPAVNGQITLDESYEGFGEIVSITYRER